MDHETMECDVLIVGAGPAGLAAACQILKSSEAAQQGLSVCVVEKASEVGGHTLSGAVLDPRSLEELFPDWRQRSAPLDVAVTQDEVHYMMSPRLALKFPKVMVPGATHNRGNYVVSMGNVCRWLAQQAEDLGVDIFTGFAARDLLIDENGVVVGVRTGDMGVARNGDKKAAFTPGINIKAKYTIFAEGCRGHLGKQLIERFSLQASADTQHYALGIKELWEVGDQQHQPGKVVHAMGWPLTAERATGGGFLYHMENRQVSVGLITDLSYRNPYLSPFDEFQRFKTHPLIRNILQGGKRISYGARAINKGGYQAIPKLVFPGGLLVGCDAGFMNYTRIKGNHTAMKTGMLAAQAVVQALCAGDPGGAELTSYPRMLRESWVYKELYAARNVGPAMHRLGMFWGGAFTLFEQQILRAKLPFTLRDAEPDHETLYTASRSRSIAYSRPDGKITFDKASSVYLSNTHHEEDQPCHLLLRDEGIPVAVNLPRYDEPAQRYCPAGVYEIVEDAQSVGGKRLQINAQNCVHCKACDIKDPSQNICWVTPQGGGGPNYPNM